MLCKAHGKLVLQMQGLSFLGKLNFRFLHKKGCQFQTETFKVKWIQTERYSNPNTGHQPESFLEVYIDIKRSKLEA